MQCQQVVEDNQAFGMIVATMVWYVLYSVGSERGGTKAVTGYARHCIGPH